MELSSHCNPDCFQTQGQQVLMQACGVRLILASVHLRSEDPTSSLLTVTWFLPPLTESSQVFTPSLPTRTHVVGLEVLRLLCHRAQPLWEPQHTAPGLGNHSLRCGTDGAGLGVPGPVNRLGLSGSHALRHPGAAGSCRMGGRLDRARGWGKGGSADPTATVLCLTAAGLSLGLRVVMAGSAERPSAGD